MADDDKDAPVGELHVEAGMRLPQTDSLYKALNHAMDVARISVQTRTCTRAQAEEIVKRIREHNKDVVIYASWIGREAL